ncbi:MAG: hypothetical protein IJ635_03765 [Bacteroidaceae bacterium]|nr:hypothetical protein [Bacteroidaceae bacterium]
MRKLLLFVFLINFVACSDNTNSVDNEEISAVPKGLVLCQEIKDGEFLLETSTPSSLNGITIVDTQDRGDYESAQLRDDSLYRDKHFLLVRQDSCTYTLKIYDNPQAAGYNRYLLEFYSTTTPYIYLVAFIYTNDKWEVWNEGPTILKAIEAIESKAI